MLNTEIMKSIKKASTQDGVRYGVKMVKCTMKRVKSMLCNEYLTSVLKEAYSEWTLLDFDLKQVLLIQEQYN